MKTDQQKIQSIADILYSHVKQMMGMAYISQNDISDIAKEIQSLQSRPEVIQPAEPQEEPPKYPTSWRDFTMTDKIEPKQTAEEGIKDLRNLLTIINEQIEHPKDCFLMDLKALWNSISDAISKIEYAQNQQPEISVSDFEIEAKYPILSSSQMDTDSWNNRLRQEGAKWLRDKLKRTV